MLTERPIGGLGRSGRSGVLALLRTAARARVGRLFRAADSALAPGSDTLLPALRPQDETAGLMLVESGFVTEAGSKTKNSVKALVQASPPAIAGTASGQTTYDSASMKPFAAVSITDPNTGVQVETVTIVLSNSTNGVLTDPNTASDGSSFLNGTYTVSGTAAQVSSDVDALVDKIQHLSPN